MAYLKPPWFTAKIFNKVAMATGVSGCETLTVTRRSGAHRQLPVITVEVGGTKYLVSTRGESQWVKNVRATPRVILTTQAGAVPYLLKEVPVDQREPVLAAYRTKAGKTVEGYFRKLPNPADHPVFTLTPA
jgi:deazaflavin-dependent oxidoreductase (nitroreductase family)